ncbi:hypothetical protein CTA1_12714 [Colletotrichum tanaceti]|uniref:Uncharacterized protein n=1 Tax=Colletotrichum tanaceti TaxID=1306861 RepID=A0A4U6X6R4_9PEZI|nr:hypothetical protein CTA1_12714 [Colletotrichum tanaceti]
MGFLDTTASILSPFLTGCQTHIKPQPPATMKFATTIAPLLALVPVCTANFDIYMNNGWTLQSGSTGWNHF